MIRNYRTEDARHLAAFEDEPDGDGTHNQRALNQRLLSLHEWGGRVWVLEVSSAVVAYAAVAPVPGLEHIGELSLCVAPEQRRRGHGSHLLAHLLVALHGSPFRQVSYAVEDVTAGAAAFLRSQGFFVEHEECVLERPLADLPRADCGEGVNFRTLPRNKAIPLFCRLYEASFRDLPWYQPFTQAEVASTLTAADDLLFLVENGETAGAAWLRAEAGQRGIIEPIGLLPTHQGRGLGRCFLVEALRQLAGRGLTVAQIGTWCNNGRALRLYEQLDFRHVSKLSYMAYDLK